MIFNPSPSNLLTEMLRRLFNRRVQDGVPALLGNGLGRVDVEGMQGFVYVRFTNNKNADGFALSGSLSIARSGDASYPYYDGAQVFVAYNYSGELEVKGANYAGMRQTGIDTRVLNQLNPQSKFVYPWQLTYGLITPVATPTTSSLKAMMKWFRHFTGDVFADFETPDEASKIDFSAHIPAADMQCFAAVWIDTYTNAYSITTSTPQGLDDPLDLTDIQECVTGRPADAMPFKVVRLSNDQTTLKQTADESDLRQHMHTPPIWGWLRTLVNQERVRDDRTFIVPGDSDTTDSNPLVTLESGARLLIVHKSNITNSAPTSTDDSDSGYSVGSPWFDKSTGTLYVATDVTVGAAVWDAVTGSSGMTSWTLAGDGGTPQTITDGNTVTIAGGTALTTTASATDTLTINLDNTAVTPGSYTNMSATVDAQGRLTSASSGATPITSFTLAGDTGTPQTISNGDTLTVSGGVGLTVTAGATDKVTLDLDNTAVTPASYTNLNATIDQQGRITAASNGTAPVNPPFVDTQTIIKGSADATKLLRFEVDGFTTGTTRVLTPPDADAEIVGRTTAQILTGKTIDGDDNTLQDIPLTAIKTNASNTNRFVWRNGSGVITDAIQPSFLNALHDHTTASEGGQIQIGALGQDGATTNQFAKWNGTFWQPSDLNLIAILRDEKTSGTNGGTSSNTTWNARDLNTELYDPLGIVSISSNQFTPIAGDYEIEVVAPFVGGSAALSLGRCRLYNVTGSASIEEGLSTFAATNAAGIALLNCKFTANGTNAYRIDTYTSVGRATTGLGAQVGDGSAEVYTSVILRKVG